MYRSATRSCEVMAARTTGMAIADTFIHAALTVFELGSASTRLFAHLVSREMVTPLQTEMFGEQIVLLQPLELARHRAIR